MIYKWIKKKGRLLYVPKRLVNEDGWIYIFNRRIHHGSNTSWATWDGTTKSGWKGSDNTFIGFLNDTNANSNEIGQHSFLSEVDRTLTQVDNVAGAIGDPLYRPMEGEPGSECFTVTPTWLNTFFQNKSSYTFLIECYVVNTVTNQVVCDFHPDSTSARLGIQKSANKVLFWIGSTTGSEYNGTTANNMPLSQIIWFAIFRRTWSSSVYGGFSTSRPIRQSDFGTGDIVSIGASSLNAAFPADKDYAIFGQYPDTRQNHSAGRIYKVIASSDCLIGS